MQLPEQAKYYPFRSGRYEINTGYSPLSTNFGNGAQDQNIFQIDNRYFDYIANKQSLSQASPELFIREPDVTIKKLCCQYIRQQLCYEHPETFDCTGSGLNNSLTNKHISYQKEYSLHDLILQVQEDLVIMQREKQNNFNVAGIYLYAPNHWAGPDKFNLDFNQLHEEVPGMEKMRQQGNKILQAAMDKGPYVRFAWGIDLSPELNQHPSINTNHQSNRG